MTYFWRIATVALLGLTLVGCSNGNGSGTDDGNGGGDDGAMNDTPVEFAVFVKDQINNTEPFSATVEINDREFDFNNRGNEAAFDDLF